MTGDLLTRVPDEVDPREVVAWLREGDGMVGWGRAAVVRTAGSGRFEAAEAWWDQVRADAQVEDPRDAKTALQEWAQANGMPPPLYEQTERSGPDHAPVFLITARLADGQQAQAQGAGTKRSIEQAAAQAMLDQIGDIP